MRILGLDMGSKTMNISLIETQEEEWEVIETNLSKMELNSPNEQNEVKSFNTQFQEFVKSNKVDLIAIKERRDGPRFSGSGTSFKIEGIVQLSDKEVRIVSDKTVKQVMKKHQVEFPKELYKYQYDAFKAAYSQIF